MDRNGQTFLLTLVLWLAAIAFVLIFIGFVGLVMGGVPL